MASAGEQVTLVQQNKGELVTVQEVNVPAHKFYNILRNECFHIPNHIPHHIQGIDVHEGDWETDNSVKIWNYTLDGKPEVFKEMVQADDKNMAIKFIGVGGDVMEIYKEYSGTFEVSAKGQGRGCIVKLTLDYEKKNESDPPPHKYLDFLSSFIQEVGAALAKA